MSDAPKTGTGTRLGDLSDEQVVSLVGMLDRVRDHEEGAVLRRSVQDQLRPMLRVARPPRPMTLVRLFCLPFEDLLHNDAPGARPGMIARAAIMPAWQLVERHGDAAELEALRRQAAPLAMRDTAQTRAIGAVLWPMASRILVAHCPAVPPVRDPLGAELGEIGAILALSDRAMTLRRLLSPKPVAALTEPMMQSLSALFDAAEPALRLARMAAARMADPVELLQLLPAETARVMRAHIVADMERRVAAVAAVARRGGAQPDPTLVAETAEAVVQRIRRLGDRQPKGESDPALRVLIGRVASAVKAGVVDGSEQAILAAVKPDGAADAGLAVADVETAARAEDHASSLKRCERIAGDMGLVTDINGAVKQAAGATERTADQLIASLRPRSDGEVTFYRAVRLMEILVGPDRADALRLRGEAALQAALKLAMAREVVQPS